MLSVEVQNRISNYTPRLPADQWSPIALFVRQAVADCEFPRVDTSTVAMKAVSRLVHWCHEVACLELDRDVVFHVDTIERFVAQLENSTAHTKGTYRSRLLRVAERLIGPQIASYRHKQFARSVSPDAYSAEELLDLRTVRNNQSTEYRRTQLGVFLALGAGAGLAPGEMNRLRQSHVRNHAGGYVIDVITGDITTRTVPLIGLWDELLAPALIASEPDAPVFLPQRTTKGGDNAATNFVAGCNSTTTHPNSWRLRSTFVVAHLNAGTPLPDLLEIFGCASLSKFERFIPFLERLEPATRHAHMRLVSDLA